MYEYTYDAEGLRIGKESGSAKTGYLYENGNILLETDGKNHVTAKNIWGNRLIERDADDTSYSYRFDGHGDITALTDKLGAVLKDYAYDPYGNDTTTTNRAPEFAKGTYNKHAEKEYNNPFRYCGEYYDLSSGTYYLRARYYDPTIGRFLSEDMYRGNATDPLSLNLYSYCEGNPVVYSDPTGHWAEGYTDKNGVYHADPDYEEFHGSIAYQALAT
jgi:RHS repeat-associated protein